MLNYTLGLFIRIGGRMIKLTMVRHGETDWNSIGRLQGRMNIELNDTGKQQAFESSQVLKDSEWDNLLTSPQMRAKQTALIINEVLNLDFVEMDEFMEMYFGDGEGLLIEERLEKHGKNPIYPNQESVEDFYKRIDDGLNTIIESYKGKNVVLATHGKVLNYILESVSKGELESGNIGLINGSITTLIYDKGQWSIETFNEASHITAFSDKGRI